jgi:hypothetical protein
MSTDLVHRVEAHAAQLDALVSPVTLDEITAGDVMVVPAVQSRHRPLAIAAALVALGAAGAAAWQTSNGPSRSASSASTTALVTSTAPTATTAVPSTTLANVSAPVGSELAELLHVADQQRALLRQLPGLTARAAVNDGADDGRSGTVTILASGEIYADLDDGGWLQYDGEGTARTSYVDVAGAARYQEVTTDDASLLLSPILDHDPRSVMTTDLTEYQTVAVSESVEAGRRVWVVEYTTDRPLGLTPMPAAVVDPNGGPDVEREVVADTPASIERYDAVRQLDRHVIDQQTGLVVASTTTNYTSDGGEGDSGTIARTSTISDIEIVGSPPQGFPREFPPGAEIEQISLDGSSPRASLGNVAQRVGMPLPAPGRLRGATTAQISEGDLPFSGSDGTPRLLTVTASLADGLLAASYKVSATFDGQGAFIERVPADDPFCREVDCAAIANAAPAGSVPYLIGGGALAGETAHISGGSARVDYDGLILELRGLAGPDEVAASLESFVLIG